MNEETVQASPRTYSAALLAAIAVALLLGIGGIIWTYTLSAKLAAQQQAVADSTTQNTKLAAALQDTNARLNVATDELKNSLGLTQKQLDTRSRRYRSARFAVSRRQHGWQPRSSKRPARWPRCRPMLVASKPMWPRPRATWPTPTTR